MLISSTVTRSTLPLSLCQLDSHSHEEHSATVLISELGRCLELQQRLRGAARSSERHFCREDVETNDPIQPLQHILDSTHWAAQCTF